MERRFDVRLEELLADAQVAPEVLRGMLPRLQRFLEPFVRHLRRSELRETAHCYVSGLLSKLESKNAESIAYLHDLDRQVVQKFIGQASWKYRPFLDELVQQVGQEIGEGDAVLVFDPSAFPKRGTKSVGVARQWCGRLGKVDNCQVGVYLGYASRKEHALVDVRLYLPREWAKDRKRRREAGVPREIRFRTRLDLALEMLDANGPRLPHAWIVGDDEMGRSTRFRRALRERKERYLLAVPSNILVRDLCASPPPYVGHGRYPQAPFQRVDRWAAALPPDAWKTIDVRDGEKGPLVVQVAKTRVLAKTEERTGDEETLVVVRERQANGTWEHQYLLSAAPVETPRCEFARAFKARHRIEECLQRAKSEAGLADYEIRTWEGWHHHQTLSLVATWFLTEEARRGKKTDSGTDGTAGALGDRRPAGDGIEFFWTRVPMPHDHASLATPRASSLLPLEKT